MNCVKCNETCIKKGFQKNGTQKFLCKWCLIWQQEKYNYRAYNEFTNQKIVMLLKESCGTRSISRILGISPTTVIQRILLITSGINIPPILFGKSYEVDEMFTYLGNKNRRICITYAIDRKTRDVVSYSVGRRNKTTLRMVVNTLLISGEKEIRTDKFSLYSLLIPEEIHCVKSRGTNYIERKNLTLRTHLKRLNRRTIAYSKSLLVLSAVLRIYFWY
jgi:insertion element IS1 protein InsB